MIPKLEKFRRDVISKLPPIAAAFSERVFCAGYCAGIEASLVAIADPHLGTDAALELLRAQIHEAREIAKKKPEPSSC